MKFVWVPSLSRYRRTETEVKKEKLEYEVIERETDKDSLIDLFNQYEERIEALWAELRESPETVAIEAPPSGIAEAMAPPEVEEPEDTSFDPKLLQEQVEAFGSAGDSAMDRLESYQALTGVGFAFSRGVHLLSVIAAGEHQLVRVFQRRRKKFGS